MIDTAARFIQDRADALFVYRGGERSPGYRFYRRTHHGDLYYTGRLEYRPGKGGQISQPGTARGKRSSRGRDFSIEVLPWGRCVDFAEELLSVFGVTYGDCGGYWHRDRDYYAKILASHVYRNDEGKLFLARRANRIVAYAVCNPRDNEGYYVYDLAALDDEAVVPLVDAAAVHAGGEIVRILANREHPLYDALLDTGFVVSADDPCIMARVVRPDRLFERLAGDSAVIRDARLEVATPHRTVALNSPAAPPVQATLYMKEALLSRLLLRRLDLRQALEMNLVRMTPLPADLETELCHRLRFCRWAASRMDYI
jgi:hypothetical protein